MKIRNQTIIAGIGGLTIGVVGMFFVKTDKALNDIIKNMKTEQVIRENINTCEDIIEWMGQDKKNYPDSTVFDSYIWVLDQMTEENRDILYKK